MVKKIILSVGYPSFPLGFAQVQRQMLLAKALLLAGIEVIVLCRYGIHNQSDAIESEGNFEGINYIYCTGTSIRPDVFFAAAAARKARFLTSSATTANPAPASPARAASTAAHHRHGLLSIGRGWITHGHV